jgi:hypothetical protein
MSDEQGTNSAVGPEEDFGQGNPPEVEDGQLPAEIELEVPEEEGFWSLNEDEVAKFDVIAKKKGFTSVAKLLEVYESSERKISQLSKSLSDLQRERGATPQSGPARGQPAADSEDNPKSTEFLNKLLNDPDKTLEEKIDEVLESREDANIQIEEIKNTSFNQAFDEVRAELGDIPDGLKKTYDEVYAKYEKVLETAVNKSNFKNLQPEQVVEWYKDALKTIYYQIMGMGAKKVIGNATIMATRKAKTNMLAKTKASGSMPGRASTGPAGKSGLSGSDIMQRMKYIVVD